MESNHTYVCTSRTILYTKIDVNMLAAFQSNDISAVINSMHTLPIRFEIAIEATYCAGERRAPPYHRVSELLPGGPSRETRFFLGLQYFCRIGRKKKIALILWDNFFSSSRNRKCVTDQTGRNWGEEKAMTRHKKYEWHIKTA